jgi:DNA-binding NtrC family response regulator
LKSRRFSSPSPLSSGGDHHSSGHFSHRSSLAEHGLNARIAPPHAVASELAQEINPFLGTSRIIQRLRDLAHRVAGSDSAVLILGETGSGKGLLANWLHTNSNRRHEQFLDLNCAGLDREFLETELFGHEKGAFTSAIAAKPGLLEIANHGTVFFDEIGDVDLQVQPKLLKVLETGRFRRLGEVRDRFSDVRLISATHRDLGRDVGEGRFRPDLFYRINIILLEVPALRSRPEDIPLLANNLLRSMSRETHVMELDRSALESLQRYSWPGNIRELRNVLQRALLVTDAEVITSRELQFFPARLEEPARRLPVADLTLDELEKTHIAAVLAQEFGSIQKAARRLGIPRSSLYNKLNRFGIGNGRV